MQKPQNRRLKDIFGQLAPPNDTLFGPLFLLILRSKISKNSGPKKIYFAAIGGKSLFT
jgi:hypothetical protein